MTNKGLSNLALTKQNWFCSVRFHELTKVGTDNKLLTMLCFQWYTWFNFMNFLVQKSWKSCTSVKNCACCVKEIQHDVHNFQHEVPARCTQFSTWCTGWYRPDNTITKIEPNKFKNCVGLFTYIKKTKKAFIFFNKMNMLWYFIVFLHL